MLRYILSKSASNFSISRNRRLPNFILAMVTIGLTGCVTVPQYDATTDSSLSAVQKEIDTEMVEWISDVQSTDPTIKAKTTYAQTVSFYDKVDTDLESLELRIEAVPDPSTKDLPQRFTNIRTMLASIQKIQREHDAAAPQVYFAPREITGFRNQFNVSFAPMITYELMLKGVSSPKIASTSSTATATANAAAAAP